MFRRGSAGTDVRCRRGGRHHLRTERLEFRHPTNRDLTIAMAGASDNAAQRWLGWRPEQVIAHGYRAGLLATCPGGGTGWAPPDEWLIAVDPGTGRLAGALGLHPDDTVGGWLVPAFRRNGLGRELFRAAATLAHDHLGIATIRAGTEETNRACIGALTAAGFAPSSGPPMHRLPDGRSVRSRWFQHDTEHPRTCGFRQEPNRPKSPR